MKQCDVLVISKGKDRSPKMLLGALSRNTIQLREAKTHQLPIKSLHWLHQYKHSLRWTRSKQPTTWIEKHGQKNQEKVQKRGNWGQLKPSQGSHHPIKEGMRSLRKKVAKIRRQTWINPAGVVRLRNNRSSSFLKRRISVGHLLDPHPTTALLVGWSKTRKTPTHIKSKQIKATPHKTHQRIMPLMTTNANPLQKKACQHSHTHTHTHTHTHRRPISEITIKLFPFGFYNSLWMLLNMILIDTNMPQKADQPIEETGVWWNTNTR